VRLVRGIARPSWRRDEGVGMRKLALSMAVAAALLAACSSGGGDPKPAGTPTTVPPTPMAYSVPTEISAEQLGSMTLALTDFGPQYATYATLVDSELTLVLERAVDACDPLKEQTALNKYGWSKGYSRWFGFEGDILEQVGTDIDVYSTSANADTKIRYDIKQLRQDQLAPRGCGGIGIERITDLALPTVGDQTWSVRVDFSVDHVRGSMHLLRFRRDRIVATVTIMRFNASDSSQELHDLAKKVDERLLTIITSPLTSNEPKRDRTPL
jgi:hypothetical protein